MNDSLWKPCNSHRITCGPRYTARRVAPSPVSHRSPIPGRAVNVLSSAGNNSTSAGNSNVSSSDSSKSSNNGFTSSKSTVSSTGNASSSAKSNSNNSSFTVPLAATATSLQDDLPPTRIQPPANTASNIVTPASDSSTSTTTSSSSRFSSNQKPNGKKAVVIGGGWAGFGAALALAKAGADVTLLDAAENPGGLSSAFLSAGGQTVEPGIKGFWYQYSNIEALVHELSIPDPFTSFTKSSFWSPEGLLVESPIFQDLPRLPTPFGSFLHTALLFRNLSVLDRLTAVPLVNALLEHDLDEARYSYYDSMSAFELFKSAGVSKQLYDKFLAPMLLVTLFAPPTELSAAAALGALYYFALAHQPDFDVRWCKGPIGQLIFTPLVEHLKALGVRVLGSRRVQDIVPAESQNPEYAQPNPKTLNRSATDRNWPGVVVARGPEGSTERYIADVFVLAAGLPALQRFVTQSRVLASAEDLRGVLGLRCSDVLAVRVWLDQQVELRSVSNVIVGCDDGVGGTFFHLNKLQDMYSTEPGSVIEFDLYHAESLLPLSDEAIMTRMLQTYLAPALPGGLEQAETLTVKDSSVLRFRNAVTRFSPGSHALLPDIVTSIPNVFVAGDCVKQGPGTHGCKGLSQEKAYVSGLQAGNHAASRLGLTPAVGVLPVEADEPHVAAAKAILKLRKDASSAFQNPFKIFDGQSQARMQQQGLGGSNSSSGASNRRTASIKRNRSSDVSSTQSERRAVESHELRKLLKDEMAEQVTQQQQQQRQIDHQQKETVVRR